jgi:hypothetical protein
MWFLGTRVTFRCFSQSEVGCRLLREQGTLFGCDSTHKTNKENKQLYTIVTKLGNDKIAPAACIIVGDDKQENLEAGLFTLVQMVGAGWNPRVAMVDDAFHGLDPLCFRLLLDIICICRR